MDKLDTRDIPYGRIKEILTDIFIVPTFSEGTVKNILSKNKEKATPVYDSILKYIEKMKAAGMDEREQTSLHVSIL